MATTATRGGQPGNSNGKKPRIWTDALRKYAVQNPQVVAKAAEQMWLSASEGDVAAAKELADRLEGKATQAIEQTTEHKGTVEHRHVKVPDLSIDEWMIAHGLGTATRPAK